MTTHMLYLLMRKGDIMAYVRVGVIILISMLLGIVQPAVQAAHGVVADQTAAMHPNARSDIAKNATAPLYQIVGTVNPSKRTWQATQTHTFTNQTGGILRTIYYRLTANLPDVGGSITLSGATVNGRKATVTYEANRYLARLDMRTPIAKNATVTVVVSFTTTAANNGGENVYGTLNSDGQTIALAMAYPLLAMHTNGTWDTTVPDTTGDIITSPVAFYDVTITTPRTYTVVSTGTPVSTRINGTNQTVRMVSGLQRDFALAVSTLSSVNATVDGTKITVYYPNGQLKGGQASLTYASHALRIFNGIYGQYPYNELDIVTVNAGTFEGIELPGFVLIEQAFFTVSSDYERLVVHEVAHQWFYGVIGNDVQNHAWVDEGITSYSQVLYQEALYGTQAGINEKRIFVDDYAALKTKKQDGAVDRPVSEMSDYQYGVLSYSKAALYVDAIRSTIGANAFSAALKSYYTTNRYAIVDGTAFVRAVQGSCDCDIQPLYNQWILAK